MSTVDCFSVGRSTSTGIPTPTDTTLTSWFDNVPSRSSLLPLSNSVLFFPPEMYMDNVTYYLPIPTAIKDDGRSSRRTIQGLDTLQEACTRWETSFETDRGDVTCHLQRVSQISPTTLIVQWNVTWVPPTAQWMLRLVQEEHDVPFPSQEQLQQHQQQRRWKADYRSYNHLSGTPSTFSYVGLMHLWVRALTTGVLTIPLACIQGTTLCEMRMVHHHPPHTPNHDDPPLRPQIYSIREDLVLVQELNRGYLKNRKGPQDLKLFLETGRRIQINDKEDDDNDYEMDWDTVVETSFPWSTVPGMMGLEVDANAQGEEWVPVAFVTFSALAMTGFALFLAPVLL